MAMMMMITIGRVAQASLNLDFGMCIYNIILIT